MPGIQVNLLDYFNLPFSEQFSATWNRAKKWVSCWKSARSINHIQKMNLFLLSKFNTHKQLHSKSLNICIISSHFSIHITRLIHNNSVATWTQMFWEHSMIFFHLFCLITWGGGGVCFCLFCCWVFVLFVCVFWISFSYCSHKAAVWNLCERWKGLCMYGTMGCGTVYWKIIDVKQSIRRWAHGYDHLEQSQHQPPENAVAA